MNKYILITLLLIIVIGAGLFIFKGSNKSFAPLAAQTKVGSVSGLNNKVKFSDTADSRSAVKIFPGQISDKDKPALTGYAMQTKDMGNGIIQIILTPNGNSNQALTYQIKSDQSLYFVEKRMGDDQSPSTDTNLEDDYGVIVDNQGFVVSQ